MATIETTKIKANNDAGYVIVNVEDENSEANAKWIGGTAKAEKVYTEADAIEQNFGKDESTEAKSKKK